jgi:hypothetical protein
MKNERNESWEEREKLIKELKSDPVLRPYFEEGTLAVTNGPEKASFEFDFDLDFPLKKWVPLIKRIIALTDGLISFPETEGHKKTIPYESGTIPPPGYILAEDDDGEKFWLHPGSLIRSPPAGNLTEDQIGRIKAYKKILKEVETAPLEKSIEDFRRDGDPESEIRVWEKIARNFKAEEKYRKNASPGELRLLLSVLLQCSIAGTAQVLSVFPAAKTLPQVKRVLKRWNEEP